MICGPCKRAGRLLPHYRKSGDEDILALIKKSFGMCAAITRGKTWCDGQRKITKATK